MAKERELVTIRGSRVVHIHRTNFRRPIALMFRVSALGRVVRVSATYHMESLNDYVGDMNSWLHYLQEQHKKAVPLVAC